MIFAELLLLKNNRHLPIREERVESNFEYRNQSVSQPAREKRGIEITGVKKKHGRAGARRTSPVL